MRKIVFLAASLACGEAFGQNPPPAPDTAPRAVVVGPINPVDADGMVLIDASQSISNYALRWQIAPQSSLLKMDQDGRKAIYGIVAPPLAPDTMYTITVQALAKSANGDPDGAAQTFSFRTRPKVTPAPTPIPPADVPVVADPDIPVFTGKLRVVLVYPNGDMTTRALRSESTIATQLAALNCTWVAINDQMATPGRSTPIIADWGFAPWYAKNPTPAPVLFIQDATTGQLMRFSSKTDPTGLGFQPSAPTSADAIVATIKAIRGIK